MNFKLPKSKRGVARQYGAIIAACRRDLSGGLQFGMDWPTIRITFPERYAHIQAMKAIYQELPL
jgi:hypothetical protein